jgi:general L-amino acid transport system substrate-binding protein
MMKRLAVLFAVLALVAAACGGSSSDEDTTTTTSGGDTGQETGESTLDVVKARGTLKCGVSGSAVGFSETDAEGNTTGFDADYCRAVAAAVLGDAEAVEFRTLTAAERFEALKNGEVDVLIRNTTWTQSRDVTLGLDFAPTTFYDGQQMMGDPAVLSGLTEASGFEALDGAVVCTNAGTTTEKNISEGADLAGVSITLETVETFPEAMEKFIAGGCDIVTTDGSGLYGNRAANVASGTPGAEAWVIFPEAPISKEPLGPAYRQNDSLWADAVDWTVYATFIADELGVTSENFDEMMEATPELVRLFGGAEELQTAMGLPADAFAQAVKQVGSYGEIFERNLTIPLGIVREGTYNAQWNQGGLIYAPPAR